MRSPSLRYDLVSFDLDGTLVDTAAEIAEAVNLALADHGIAPRPQAEITTLIGPGTKELMLRLLARILIEQPVLAPSVRPDAVLASMDRHYALTTGSAARPYDGCVDALQALQQAGLRLACVTNKEAHHARRVLEVTGLKDFFDLVVGGDSLPEKKPHRNVLLHVAANLGCAVSRCAHVGDSVTDVEAARNAGFAAWAVPYGYNAGVPIAECRPARIFGRLAEIAGHVLAGQEQVAA